MLEAADSSKHKISRQSEKHKLTIKSYNIIHSTAGKDSKDRKSLWHRLFYSIQKNPKLD